MSEQVKPGTGELRQLAVLARLTKELLDNLLVFESFTSWSERLLLVSVEQLRDRVELLWQHGPGSEAPDMGTLARGAVTETDARLATALATSVRTNVARVREHAEVLRRSAEDGVSASVRVQGVVLGVATRLEEATMASWWC